METHSKFEVLSESRRIVARTQVMWDEIQLLQQTPPRLHRVLAALGKAAGVASECIAVRCKRPDTDLVRDQAHEELVREAALVREVMATHPSLQPFSDASV